MRAEAFLTILATLSDTIESHMHTDLICRVFCTPLGSGNTVLTMDIRLHTQNPSPRQDLRFRV